MVAGMQMPQSMGADYTQKFREVFATVARERKSALIPFLLEGVGGKAELNLPDRIHPNPEGHKVVADTVWKTLEGVIR